MTRRKPGSTKRSPSRSSRSGSRSPAAKRDPAPDEKVTEPGSRDALESTKTLMVKFANGADPAIHTNRLTELIGPKHLKQAEQLFPGDLDEQLASIYQVTLSSRASLVETVAVLQEQDEIEYAHEPAPRESR